MREVASGQSKPCIFPFVFENKVHYGCTTDGAKEPWCSTNVIDTKHVTGGEFYGDCPKEQCPMEEATKLIEIDQFLFHPGKYLGIIKNQLERYPI